MKKIAFLAVPLLPLLTACGGGNLGEEIKAKLIPSWVSFVVQFVALLVLLLIVFVFAYKPVKKILQKRSDYIEQQIKDAEENKAISERNISQANEIILASKKEAKDILEAAHKQAKINHDKAIEDTQNEVNKMKRDAEQDIILSKQEAIEDIHNEIVDVALLASAEVLKREVNKDDNARLVEEFIDKLD
jgi:F-type H+-transporting ATPase subunit b